MQVQSSLAFAHIVARSVIRRYWIRGKPCRNATAEKAHQENKNCVLHTNATFGVVKLSLTKKTSTKSNVFWPQCRGRLRSGLPLRLEEDHVAQGGIQPDGPGKATGKMQLQSIWKRLSWKIMVFLQDAESQTAGKEEVGVQVWNNKKFTTKRSFDDFPHQLQAQEPPPDPAEAAKRLNT